MPLIFTRDSLQRLTDLLAKPAAGRNCPRSSLGISRLVAARQRSRLRSTVRAKVAA